MAIKILVVSFLTMALVVEPAVATSPMLGQVTARGQIRINAVTTPSGATIFPGDKVNTEANSIAEITLSGGNKVLLPESSGVVLNQDGSQVTVNLTQGALAVLSKSSVPTFIEANGALIRPAADTAVVLEVAVHDNVLKVLARRGSATVETADKTLEVNEGKELDATLAPAAPQGVAGASPAGRSKLMMWIFIVAVGSGLTGLTLGIIAITRPNPTDCTFVSTTGKIVCP